MPRRPTVFVVEDHEDTRTILKEVLSAEGFLVVPAGGGEDALRRLGYFIPDVIVTDLMMPKLDGLAFLERLRRLPSVAGVPVIVVTARAEADVLVGPTRPWAFFQKPFDLDALVDAIRAAGEHAIRAREQVR